MSPTYIKRTLEPVLKKAASEFPAVVLTGAKQRSCNIFSESVAGTFLLNSRMFGRPPWKTHVASSKCIRLP